MCQSHCNTCNYCVSQCTCSNPTLVVPGSIPQTGCMSTNYGRCVYYSGNNLSGGITVTNGQTLDSVISTINTAILNLTPADLNWGSFDYQCLRADGSLTASGSSNINTGQEFAEAVSIALCNLAGAVDVTPNVTIAGPCSSYFTGITPGTSTLVEILNNFIVKLCALNALNNTAGVSNSCSAGTWTTVPAGGSTLGTWVTWIKTNVCSLVSAVQSDISDLQDFQSDVETFVGDSSFTLFDNSASCISGSGSDSLVTTIGLIKTRLCAINTTVSGLPNFSALTLPWGSCSGLFPSYGNTASLSTQLTRIVNEIAARTFSFSGDFTVSSTSCGTTVALASPGGSFTCSNLGTCSLENIGDVNDYTLGTGASFNSTGLFWNSTATGWSAKKFAITSSNGTCTIATTDNDIAGTLTFNIASNISANLVSDPALSTPVALSVGSPSGGTTPLTLTYNPNLMGGTGTAATFAYNAPTSVLAPANSTAGPPSTLNTLQGTVQNSKIFINGQLDLVVSGGGLAAGTQYNLGTFSVTSASTTTYWSSAYSLMNLAGPSSVPVFVGITGNVLSIYTLAAVPAATYTLSLAGQTFTY